MIKIFQNHLVKTCLLDDFEFYENRQKAIQDKKARQLQFQKQASHFFPVAFILFPSRGCYECVLMDLFAFPLF